MTYLCMRTNTHVHIYILCMYNVYLLNLVKEDQVFA